jgi:hypothetical protein
MKNLSTSYQAKPQNYQETPQDYTLEITDDSSVSLSQGIYRQVEDWVALELTAEQMLSSEVDVIATYVAGDAKQMWAAIKDSVLPYELAAEYFLLRAADPTQVEWLQGHWWNGEERLQY